MVYDCKHTPGCSVRLSIASVCCSTNMVDLHNRVGCIPGEEGTLILHQSQLSAVKCSSNTMECCACGPIVGLEPCDAGMGAVIFFCLLPWVLASALQRNFSTDYCALLVVLAAAGLRVCDFCVHACRSTSVRSVSLLGFDHFCALCCSRSCGGDKACQAMVLSAVVVLVRLHMRALCQFLGSFLLFY